MAGDATLAPLERIEQVILLVRGHKVMLDADLAALYGVETKALTRAMKRNIGRFPPDFMFQLTKEEFDDLRRQSGTSSSWGGRRYPPYAFTEQGVAMLSGVLQSQRAVQVNIQIMETSSSPGSWMGAELFPFWKQLPRMARSSRRAFGRLARGARRDDGDG